MNKTDFMTQLGEALGGMPPEERQMALQYYEDYFADAGEDNEDRVIEDLGPPQAVAQAILNDYRELTTAPAPDAGEEEEPPKAGGAGQSAQSGAAYWHARYRDAHRGPYQNQSQTHGSYSSAGQANEQTGQSTPPPHQPQPRRVSPLLIVLIAIFAAPIWVPLVLGLAGTLVGLVAALVGLGIALVALLVSLIFVGALLFVRGVGLLVAAPFVGMTTLGMSLILLAVGICVVALAWKVFTVVLPGMIRGIVALCRRPFERRNPK